MTKTIDPIQANKEKRTHQLLLSDDIENNILGLKIIKRDVTAKNVIFYCYYLSSYVDRGSSEIVNIKCEIVDEINKHVPFQFRYQNITAYTKQIFEYLNTNSTTVDERSKQKFLEFYSGFLQQAINCDKKYDYIEPKNLNLFE